MMDQRQSKFNYLKYLNKKEEKNQRSPVYHSYVASGLDMSDKTRSRKFYSVIF